MADYAPGTPIWVDVSSRDLDASRAFYSGLFGWEARVAPEPEAGGYTVFLKDGKMVGGLGPTFSPDQPCLWATYLSTADAAATAQAVKDNGGQVLVGPMQVMDQGSMAVFVDPTGAHICVWQSGKNRGAELFNEPGSLIWNELYTRDMPTAKTFYEKVFGLESSENAMENGDTYTEFKIDGRTVAGGMDMHFLPDDVPPHWLVYLAVENVDDAAAKVQELGGKLLNPVMDIPIGRFAVVQDTQGAPFAIFQSKT
jgi:uncharacterized protein